MSDFFFGSRAVRISDLRRPAVYLLLLNAHPVCIVFQKRISTIYKVVAALSASVLSAKFFLFGIYTFPETSKNDIIFGF